MYYNRRASKQLNFNKLLIIANRCLYYKFENEIKQNEGK